MPEPDVALNLRIPGACPPEAELASVRDAALRSVSLGPRTRAAATCGTHGALGNVLIVGLWADPGNVTDAQLQQDLAATLLIGADRSAALQFSATAIQQVASTAWATIPKRLDLALGFIRLGEDVTVRLIAPDTVETSFRATWKARFLPNVPFRVTITDVLEVDRTGGQPPLIATTNSRLSANTVKFAVIASMLNPLAGALVFWKGDAVAESIAGTPDQPGAGAALAAQWPPEIMTEVAPPRLPGKLVFIWTDLSLTADRLRTTGAFLPDSRDPLVSILGRTSITVRLPVHSARETYRLQTRDMRGGLRIAWSLDGQPVGSGRTQQVSFEVPGQDPTFLIRRLGVSVTDADGLTATREVRLRFVVEVPPGKQPP